MVVQGPTKNIFGSVVSGSVFKEIADKVYAQEFHKENSIKNDSAIIFLIQEMEIKTHFLLHQSMGIPVLDKSNSTSKLITTRTGNKAIKIFNKKIQKGLVPDVVGMGLIDAVYVLEKLGLVCSTSRFRYCKKAICKGRL